MKRQISERDGERRVLHVVNDLDAAGIVPWLLELARQQTRMGWSVDVCALARNRGALAGSFEKAGCRVLRRGPGPGPLIPLRMWQLMVSRGPFSAVHAHLCGVPGAMTRMGLCLAAARLAGVAVRAVQLHTGPAGRRSFGGEALLRRFATVAISPSHRRTAEWASLIANGAPALLEARYGVGLGGGEDDQERRAVVRAELGIPRGVPVVGMIARESGGLSSAGFLRVAEEILRIRPETRFVLAGDPAKGRWFAGQARIMDLGERAFFVKWPGNPPEPPCGLFDVLLATARDGEPPSLLLKAQAAGLLVALAGEVEPQYVVLPQSVVRVAEGSGLDGWAAAAVSLLGRDRLSSVAASNLVAARGFDAADSCRRVLDMYEAGISAGKGTVLGQALPATPAGKPTRGWYA